MGHAMSDINITITISTAVLAIARQIADANHTSVESVLLERLEAAFADPLAALPAEELHELHAMKYLSDDALWAIARSQLPQDKQDRMQRLMDLNTRGKIGGRERRELTRLVEDGQRHMLRKAQAAALLSERGHAISARALAGEDA
jgi:hypothetical protein